MHAFPRKPEGAGTRAVGPMSAPRLTTCAPRSAGGSVRIVDLSQTLSPRFPQIVLPPEFDQCAPFRIEEISRYDDRGPAWYWNNFSFGEHTGTHFDAPMHWITGRDLPNNATDTNSARRVRRAGLRDRLLGRGSARRGLPAHRGPSADWEGKHGKNPAARLGADAHRLVEAHRSGRLPEFRRRPGSTRRGRTRARCASWWRSATCSASAPRRSARMPGRRRISVRPIRATTFMHGAGRYGLQCLANLDLLPPTGAVVIAAPLKIQRGSGSPVRVLALVAT